VDGCNYTSDPESAPEENTSYYGSGFFQRISTHHAHQQFDWVISNNLLSHSTIAWDLPLGGLWIGLPLAVAAIVLGLRARRAGSGRAPATAAIVIAGLCIAQMAVYTIVSSVG